MNELMRLSNRLPSVFPHSMFDDMFNDLEMDIFERVGTNMPYNVELHKDLNGNVVSTKLIFALAGYQKDNIKLKVVGDELLLNIEDNKVIEDNKSAAKSNVVEYQHKGISSKNIKLRFSLSGMADKTNIKTMFKNGLLTVEIPTLKEDERIIDITE